ncbi:MAG: hypothetical protein JWN70_1615 [Planctomycetaceae bacterium]|nr:hypothetical protein [Planctomycetaceae bacterium]
MNTFGDGARSVQIFRSRQTIFGYHRRLCAIPTLLEVSFKGIAMLSSNRSGLYFFLAIVLVYRTSYGAEPNAELVTALRALTAVKSAEPVASANMIPKDISLRMKAANFKSTADWRRLHSREDWERFRDEKLQALRNSIHLPQDLKTPPVVQVTASLPGDGFSIDNIVFESRPGLLVTANLYRPAQAGSKMPGILICHSHHNPKTESELQTMGMTWARAGCLVLVMDQLGHGERRQHPFRTATDYPTSFRVSRQDYFYRYHVALQLALAGETLIGWMAWDLHCGVDVLLSQAGIDPQRIILLGAVAGGGDPVAVAGALDPRITAVVPFNFGGPQPESRHPLPNDVEETFGYAGGGSWESTRNLVQSAGEGFLPWVIVGGIAPRHLIYAHEFSWDRERDPVWKRLNQIYEWEKAPGNLAFTLGRGSVRGQAPESTHCNNIGATHRKLIHAAWRQWFKIEIADDEEYRHPLPSDKLQALTPEVREQRHPKFARDVALQAALQRSGQFGKELQAQAPAQRIKLLRDAWSRKLGNVEPARDKCVLTAQPATNVSGEIAVVPATLQTEPGIVVPLLLIFPAKNGPVPVVIGISQHGKDRFLKENAEPIAELLARGIAVCLPDVRGTGETALEDHGRDRTSDATAYSATEQMLGGTILGARLRDLRNVVKCLRSDSRIDGKRLALWGDSFAPVNPPELELAIPEGIDKSPVSVEPLGGLLSLLTALYEDDVRAVAVHHGLSSYASVLTGPRTYLPQEMLIPDAIGHGDISALLAGIAPTPVRMWELRNGMNQSVADESLPMLYADVVKTYAGTNALLQLGRQTEQGLADWFAAQLR